MLDWIKVNRLKAVSALAVTGDMLMGVAGASELSASNTETGFFSFFLMLAGCWALIGHLVLFIWGRGARVKNATPQLPRQRLSILLKPFVPWRYPLDSAFAIWVCGGIFYTFGGFGMHNMPLVGVGVLVIMAAGVGWLWPQGRLLFGFHSVQITAILYSLSSAATIWAGVVGQNVFILLAAFAYGLCNAILYTVRKENQSTFTQTHET